MSVEQIDATDDQVFDDWYEVVTLSHRDLYPGRPGWQREELLAAVLDQVGATRTVDFVCRDDQGVVQGAAAVELPRRDNLEKAFVEIWVRPQQRRMGVGTELLHEIERFVLDDGRSVVASYMQGEPLALEGCSPGRLFAQHHGFTLGQVSARRELTLPPSAEVERSIDTAFAAAKGSGYDLLSWTGPWPDQFVEDRLLFGRRMSTDAPIGETGLEEEVWDEARLRGEEARLIAQNRIKVVTVAQERASSALVAFTEIAVPLGAPEYAYQHDTLVLAEHRGHGLGLAVKLWNIRAMAIHAPRTTTVSTWNATENQWMIAVNEALGCELTSFSNFWTKELVQK